MRNLISGLTDLFKKPQLNFVEEADDMVDPRKNADSLPFNRFASILPYTAYDEEHGLFVIEGEKPGKIEGYGFVIEIAPQLGASKEMADYLTGLFSLGMSEEVGIQIQTFGCPNINGFIERMESVTITPDDVPEHLKNQASALQQMTKQRAEFYKRGATRDLYQNLNVRMRMYRSNISVVIPANNYDNPAPRREAVSIRQQIATMLQQYYLFDFIWKPDDLINYVSMILNPHRTLNYEYPDLTYDESREIRDQIIASDTRASEAENQIVYSSNDYDRVALRAMSVRSYPGSFTLPSMAELLGSSTSTAIAYPCPFLITMCARAPNYEAEKNKVMVKAARAQQTAESQMGKFLPHLQDVNEDYKILQRGFDNNATVVQLSHQLLLMYREEDAERCEQAAKAVWRAERFEITTDKKMQKQGLLASLPMMMGPLMQKDLKTAQRISTKTSINAANLMPILGEWRGTPPKMNEQFSRPVLTLFGRKGQAMSVDIFANPSGNYNGAIVGTSGSGKSFLVNEIVRRTLGTGGRAWIIDVGQSYKKSCTLLGGQYIEIGVEEDPTERITFNPFLLINDIDEDMEMIKPLVAQMVSPSKPLDDYQASQLEQHIRSIWYDYERAGDVTLLAQSLINNSSMGGPNPQAEDEEYKEKLAAMSPEDRLKVCEPRVRDMGVQLFPFTRDGAYGKYFHEGRPIDFKSNFIVLELEQLNAKKDLRAVVMLLLMYRITQDMYMGDRKNNKIVVIDEAWDLMSSGSSGSFIEAGYRRARKYGGAFLTATQSIGDYYASPAATAALENSDWLFLLRQKKESIDALERSGKFTMDAYMKELVSSIKTVGGAYAEVLIRGGDLPPTVGRLFTDPYSSLVSSTHPDDYSAVMKYVDSGMTINDALLQVLRDRGQIH